MNKVKVYLTKNWFWLAVNLAVAMPLLLLGWDWVFDNLSVNPIDDFTDRTGKAAIVVLMLSLACTPANTVFGFRRALTVRKALGLWAFAYAALHFLVFIGLDYGFSWELIFQDALLGKQFIIAGFIALLILVPLAITSTRYWMRRLGKNWKRLHKFVYAAGVLAVVHFLLLVKVDRTEPLIYAAVLSILLLLRVPWIRKSIVTWRKGLTSNRSSNQPQTPRTQPVAVRAQSRR